MPAINIPAILLMIVTSGALGALWYSRLLFLRPWVWAVGHKPERSPLVYGLTVASALFTATIFTLWLGPRPPLGSALLHGASAGMAFAAASVGINYAFAGRGVVLWLIDGGFHLVRFTLFGLILGLWH